MYDAVAGAAVRYMIVYHSQNLLRCVGGVAAVVVGCAGPASGHGGAEQKHEHGHELVHGCWGDAHGRLEGGRFLVPVGAVPVDGAARSEHRSRGVGDNRVDLVIVGDGYTASELGQYRADAAQIAADFFRYEPFVTYQPYFRVTIVDVVSAESGVDNDPVPGISRDTAMDMAFWCSGVERLLCVNVSKAWSFASGGAADVDQILAIANSTKYGGAGYPSSNVGTVSGRNASAVEIAIHEMGHSLGKLADEYTYGGPANYNGPEPAEANLTIRDVETMISWRRKWYQWLGMSMPGFDGVIWAYEGGGYSETGINRPSPNSMMRSLNRPFNLPGAEALIKEFYREVSPIDWAAETGTAFGRGQTIMIEPMRPAGGHALTVRWYLDGSLVAEGTESLDLSMFALGEEEHSVEVVVVDETPWVIDEAIRASFLTASRVYRVIGCPVSGDLTGDGVLDLTDITAFVEAFVAGEAPADLAPPIGVYDLADVAAFVDAFVSGCVGI